MCRMRWIRLELILLPGSKLWTTLWPSCRSGKLSWYRITPASLSLVPILLYVIQIWDTAGRKSCRSIALSYVPRAHGIMLVYDITDRRSFESIHKWVEDIELVKDRKSMLTASLSYKFLILRSTRTIYRWFWLETNATRQTKGYCLSFQLQHTTLTYRSTLYSIVQKVSTAEASELANSLNIPFLEISAKTGSVTEAFIILAREAKDKMPVAQGFAIELETVPYTAMSISFANERSTPPSLLCACCVFCRYWRWCVIE